MNDLCEGDIRDFFWRAAASYGFVCAHKELAVAGLRIDIFAVDAKHDPYIIEFKVAKDRHIVGQSAQYLATVPTCQDEISKAISFHAINWDKLAVILVAPVFHERDMRAASYAPLLGRVHLYTYRVVRASRRDVFGLELTYKGPSDRGPLVLPECAVDESDFIALYRRLKKLETRQSRREFYTTHVMPLFQAVCSQVEAFFAQRELYFHASFFGSNPPYYMIRFGTHRTKAHRASISLGFGKDWVGHGFDLTHAVEEGRLLSTVLQDDELAAKMAGEIGQRADYELYIPSTGFGCFLPIEFLTPEALRAVLQRYLPTKMRECTFHIVKRWEGETLSVKDAAELLLKDCEGLSFMFEWLKRGTKA